MKTIEMYTDGGCRGNGTSNAIGGFGVVFKYKQFYKEYKEKHTNTTNNEMELLAVVRGLEMLKESCNVKIYSDSAYVVNANNQGWLNNWINNNWVTSTKKPVKNKELWQQLLKISQSHRLTFIKVKGHSNDKFNNRCDELANEAMDGV